MAICESWALSLCFYWSHWMIRSWRCWLPNPLVSTRVNWLADSEALLDEVIRRILLNGLICRHSHLPPLAFCSQMVSSFTHHTYTPWGCSHIYSDGATQPQAETSETFWSQNNRLSDLFCHMIKWQLMLQFLRSLLSTIPLWCAPKAVYLIILYHHNKWNVLGKFHQSLILVFLENWIWSLRLLKRQHQLYHDAETNR